MKFDDEICKGVSCPECSFNKGEDGCLLAKRLDEIEIISEPCEDVVPRTSVEYICRKNTVSTNPYEHKYHDKFMQFMDDPEISDFGRWQQSNGFNMALLVVRFYLARVPSVQPEPRWVSCSERLPFDAGYYLTTTTYNEVFCDYWNLNEWNRTEQVIAWMPLPEPYKGDEQR